MKPFLRCILLCLIVSPAIGAAHEYYAPNFTVIHPWADATEPDAKSAPIYFKLESVQGKDRLLKVMTPYAESVEFRANDNKSAKPLKTIDFAPADAIDFGKDKPHLLLKGLKTPLQWGRSYQMTMVFEKAGPLQVMVSVGAH
jgi:copper(I)-binding protein